VLGNGTSANRGLFHVAKIDEPDDSGVGRAENDRELAEILIEGYQHLAVLRCMSEDLVIS
jgi:hypothetical protein